MAHCVTRKKGKCIEEFEVNNYEDAYAGVQSLRSATTFSDNAVYAQVGIKVGTRKVAEPRAPDGHPHAGLAQLRDDARRPQARASRRSTWRTRTRRSPSAAASPTAR